jgi:hypothetical protein
MGRGVFCLSKKMLTIFSIPRSFEGEARIRQRNALNSWVRLEPRCEVILCGDDPGVKETAREFGVRHAGDLAVNEFGTPLMNSAFEKAAASAKFARLCFVNSDIILLDDFLPAVGRVTFPRFLLGGKRWNVDLDAELDFADAGWRDQLRARAQAEGELIRARGSDYFVFPPDGQLENLPPFAIGRPYWDGWFFFHARRLGIPVLDGTAAIMAVHQNHDYGHVAKGRERWYGPEGDRNLELIAERNETFFNLTDATYLLTPTGVVPARGWAYFRRRVYTTQYFVPAMRVPVQYGYKAWRRVRGLS